MKIRSFAMRFVLLLGISFMIASCSPANTPGDAKGDEAGPKTEETGSVNETGKTEPPSDAAPRTIYFYGRALSYPGEEEAMLDVISRFEKEFNATVETNFEGKASTIHERLQTARIANEQVDISMCSANKVNQIMVQAGMMLDLTTLIDPIKDRFNDNMFEPYTIGDHIWAIPFTQVSTSTFFYNADMFQESGLTPPKTYEELVNIAEVLNANGIMPVIHQGKAPQMWPMWFMETYAQTTGNESIANVSEFLQGRRKFTTPEEVSAFEAISRFKEDGIVAPQSLDTDGDGMRAAFVQGLAGMYYGGTWEVSRIRSLEPDFEVGVFPFPQLPGASGHPQHGGGPDLCLFIPSFAPSENLDLGLQFMEFVTRPENANMLISPQSPFYSSVKGVNSYDDPLTATLQRDIYPDTITFLDWIWPAEVNDAVVNGISGIMAGSLSAQQAADEVQKAYDQFVLEKDFTFNWWDSWTSEQWQDVTPEWAPTIVVK